MPRSSTTQLSSETVTELESQFYTFLDSLSYDEKKQFFSEFLTNEEKMMMYKRLALYWCLLEGYPLSKIQQMIGVTHDTTRVYNKKKNLLSENFKSLIQRIGKGSISEPAREEKIEAQSEPTTDEAVANEPATVQTEPSQWEVPAQESFSQEPSNTQDQESPFINDRHDEYQPPVSAAEPTDQPVDQMHEEMPKMPEEHADQTMGTDEMRSETSTHPHDQHQEEDKEKKKSGLAKFFGF
ncbi:MAG: hypothetical protein Q7T54_01880 [Candidatus Levybacteria bacterium]|nr:hypothetical protein [Candidatus Levybacteria bacterium]